MAHKDNQKGPQAHAEGQHGEKTHEAMLDQLHSPGHADSVEASDTVEHEGSAYGENPSDGKHRDGREQHDEAELNSELGRRDREQGPRR